MWRNVSTQFFTASFQFIEMCSIHSCTALSWCHHSTTNSVSLQHLDSSLFQPFHWKITVVLWIIALLYDPNVSKILLLDRWPHVWLENVLVYRGFHGKVGNYKVPNSCLCKKKAPKISPPPLCWQSVRGENGECFFQTWCFALWPFISTLTLSVQRTLLRFCGLLRCSFADLSHAAMFFSDRRHFPSKQAIPLQSISTVVNCNI